MKNICIVGTGGFAREVLFLIDELGLFNNVKAFLEPDNIWQENWKDKNLMGVPILPFSELQENKDSVSIAIGDSKIREKAKMQLPTNTNYLTLIHHHARVSKWVEIGKGSLVTAGCIITTQINIGEHAQLNLNTTIGHNCNIGDFFTTAPSCNISGNCNFGNHIYLGTGAATKQGINICDNVTIGMGAMVVKDIAESGIYVGIPAKKR